MEPARPVRVHRFEVIASEWRSGCQIGAEQMLTWGPWRGGIAEPTAVHEFGAGAEVYESVSVNLSSLMMNDGSGPALALDRIAGPRRARTMGQANGTKGGDLTCAFS